MKNKKIGIAIIGLSLLLLIMVLGVISETKISSKEIGCFTDEKCSTLSYTLSLSHLAIGLIFGIFSLGLYFLVFSKDEHHLLQQIESYKDALKKEEKLKIIRLLLNEQEQKVLTTIIEQEGITQNSLRFKTGLSKAQLSQILGFFEEKNIIRRDPSGKTYSIYLTKVI